MGLCRVSGMAVDGLPVCADHCFHVSVCLHCTPLIGHPLTRPCVTATINDCCAYAGQQKHQSTLHMAKCLFFVALGLHVVVLLFPGLPCHRQDAQVSVSKVQCVPHTSVGVPTAIAEAFRLRLTVRQHNRPCGGCADCVCLSLTMYEHGAA